MKHVVLYCFLLTLTAAVAGADTNIVWRSGGGHLSVDAFRSFLRADDFHGTNWMRVHRMALDAGTNLFPTLEAIILTSSNSREIHKTLSYLVDSRYLPPSADMSKVVERVRYFLREEEYVGTPAFTVLERYGVADDVGLIIPFLRDKHAHVKRASAHAISCIGGAEALRRMEDELFGMGEEALPFQKAELEKLRKAVLQQSVEGEP